MVRQDENSTENRIWSERLSNTHCCQLKDCIAFTWDPFTRNCSDLFLLWFEMSPGSLQFQILSQFPTNTLILYSMKFWSCRWYLRVGITILKLVYLWFSDYDLILWLEYFPFTFYFFFLSGGVRFILIKYLFLKKINCVLISWDCYNKASQIGA